MAGSTPAAGLPTLVMTKFKVADLLRVCQKCKLVRSGLKHDLQQRIIAALRGDANTPCTPSDVEAVVRDVYATTHGPPRLLPPVHPRAPPQRMASAPLPPPRDPTGPASLSEVGQLPSWMQRVVATTKLCDPFHVQEALLLVPVKLNQVPGAKPPADWSTYEDFALTQASATVALSPAHCAALRAPPGGGAPEVDLHICCIRLNDTVPGRLCWPCHASCTLNGVPCAVPVRRRANDLGPRGRDKPVTLPPAVRARLPAAGPMSLSLVACGYDTRPFAVCVILVRRLTLDAVARSVPAPASPQSCLARCVAAMATHDEDIASSAIGVSLRDPLSGGRIRTPVRYAACSGLAVFDLDAFLALAQQSLQWACPLCTACGPPTQLVRDAYVSAILKVLELTGESDAVDEVLMSSNGGWQARLPDGSLGRHVSPEETLGVAAGTQAAQATAVRDGAVGGGGGPGSPSFVASQGDAAARGRAKLPAASPPEVIVIGSSSDDEDDRAGGGAAPAAAVQVHFSPGERRPYNPRDDEYSGGHDDEEDSGEEDDAFGWLASSLEETYGNSQPEEAAPPEPPLSQELAWHGFPHPPEGHGFSFRGLNSSRLVVPLHSPPAPQPLVPRQAPSPVERALLTQHRD